MNFSSLNKEFLPLISKLVEQKFDLPAVTRSDVLRRLQKLPPVRQLQDLQEEQEQATTRTTVEEKLQAFCICAGRLLVNAFQILDDLRLRTESYRSTPTIFYSRFEEYPHLRDAVVQIGESLSIWEDSIGTEEFLKKHPRPRDVRNQYLEHTLRLIFVIAQLTLPEEYTPHREEFESFLSRDNFSKQFVWDNEKTYARSKERRRREIIASQDQTPARYVPYGLKVRRPYLVHSQSLHGHFVVVNDRCPRTGM